MVRVYYHPMCANGVGKEKTESIKELYPDTEVEIVDITTIKDIYEEIEFHSADVTTVISGGDGMLNNFVKAIGDRKLTKDVYYYAAGTGNDFYTDIKDKYKNKLVLINEYITSLPEVIVNGKTYKFLNGIGFGLDGYCCEEGDKQRESGKKNINYSGIAIKGLLFKHTPANAKITVDGKTTTYKKVWLAPTMNGRFYGGGIQIAPNQDRMNKEGKITVVALHNISRLHALMIFPKVIAGQHLGKKAVAAFSGYDITVEFDRPTALQIDGDTVRGVTSYRCISKSRNEVKTEEVTEATV